MFRMPTQVFRPGVQGTKQVPQGGQVVAALLYWQTVEKVGVTPGAAGSGQNGYFRPVLSGGPAAPGYAISGTSLNAVTLLPGVLADAPAARRGSCCGPTAPMSVAPCLWMATAIR